MLPFSSLYSEYAPLLSRGRNILSYKSIEFQYIDLNLFEKNGNWAYTGFTGSRWQGCPASGLRAEAEQALTIWRNSGLVSRKSRRLAWHSRRLRGLRRKSLR